MSSSVSRLEWGGANSVRMLAPSNNGGINEHSKANKMGLPNSLLTHLCWLRGVLVFCYLLARQAN